MWQDRAPDARTEVVVDGHRLVTYSFGKGDDVLLCLNGGPGLPCDYMREAHSFLADHGLRVVAYDQLGCGASDKPDDPTLWNIQRYAREVEGVRQALGLGRVILAGQSFGGWLALEYALTYPHAVRALILEDTACDLPHAMGELYTLREGLGAETAAMMKAHEAAGTLDHPEYQAAIALLNQRHFCRLKDVPAPLMRSLAHGNPAPYAAMLGPNGFLDTGNLKAWSRRADLHKIACPTLILAGRYDVLPPACADLMKAELPQAQLHVFEQSSHVPFYEEPEEFDRVLLAFLDQARRAP